MRRVSRATSPTAVKVSEEPPGSCFRELDDVFLQTQTRIWLGEVLQFRIDEEMPIANLLADGELLFKVSKVVWKKLLKNHVELKNSKLFLYEHTSFAKRNGRYMPYPKVDSFLKICQILGLTGIDLFSPSDVVEKRDVRRVCMCVRSFSKKARLKCLSVPDFDIVKYTIAMPTDLVGGICRSLEQSRCSLSSSSYGMDFRRVYGKKGGNAHHDHNHENGYESDEAESRYTELEFESSSPHASFRAADIFNFDPEDYPQIRSVDDDLSKLHGYFELEDQTHENNQQDKDIILESVGSTFGSIIESDNSAIQISGINCYQSRCLSHVNFPSKVESFMGENQYISFDSSVSKTCLTKPSTSNSLITTVPANGQIMETFAPANKEINSTIEEHDNMAYESRFQNKKLQEIPPICMLQSEVDSKTSCCSYSNGCTSSEGYVVDECIRCALCETSYETSDISGANYVSNHELYSGNVNGSLETGGREAINSKIVCYYFSRDQLCMEFTDTYHANEVTSDWIYISGSLSTSESAEHFNNFLACAPRESGDACFSDRGNFSCLNPGILTSLKGDISSEKDLKIEDGSHFIKDVGTITSHIDPDNTEERKKIMEGHEENLMATSTLSETRVKNTGKRVLKSFVGSISLIGALLVFLHLRKKRDKERSSHTAVPLPPQQTYQKVSTNKKVEIINYHQRYPGERLKL